MSARRNHGVVRMAAVIAAVAGLGACAQSYKADTYSSAAVQQASKVDRGVVVGFRQVNIRADGTVGAVTGGAVGGVIGTQSQSVGINPAIGTIGGTTLGGIIGTTIERVTGDTNGWEYIIQKKNGDLVSVTQQDEKAIAIGTRVLVIAGTQARMVPDYSTLPEEGTPAKAAKVDKVEEIVPLQTTPPATAPSSTTASPSIAPSGQTAPPAAPIANEFKAPSETPPAVVDAPPVL